MVNAAAVRSADPGRRKPNVWRRHWRAAASLILVIAVVCGGVGFWRWQRGLSLFESPGAQLGGQLPLHQTRYILIGDGITKHNPSTVDVRSAVARIGTNTADASVRVVECVGNGNIPIVGAVARLGFCNDLHVFAAGPLHFTNGLHTALIAVEVRARRPGRLRVHGVELTYRSGIRTGKQTTGIDLDFRAKNRNP